ncbi:unnamed protein product [Hymenolepis diminuta]|uniref:Uncharacterized protein n=1 Tax=Hymenolepis diminuta TaxID=6216 RepID=A0A564Z3F5_HYMDI|nr:unnamed protein product [Hymenolepis diminuta]
MNLSKLDKDLEDCIKNVSEFHYEPSVGEVFTTLYARNRDIHKNRMPFSPKDLTFEETIEKCEKVFGDNTSLFNKSFKGQNLAIREGKDIHKYTAAGLHSPCYREIRLKLLSLLHKSPDIIPSGG